jgi:rhomboid protease GluP
MDIDHILFLIALLNLLGDLYNISRFRGHLPRWMPWANAAALAGCVIVKLMVTTNAGVWALGILLLYALVLRIFGRKSSSRLKLPSPATKLLIAANVLAYGYQMSQYATSNGAAMIGVGALYGPLLEDGQWWRLITAQFIHWGPLHLAFNMMGLWFMGRGVEMALGWLRFIIAYLICGAGGMLLAWGISLYSVEPRAIVLMGASASVLGLVGIQAAISLSILRSTGSLVAKAQLASMTQIIVLQMVFDFMVPEVSSTAHMGGAAIGFLLGMAAFRGRA